MTLLFIECSTTTACKFLYHFYELNVLLLVSTFKMEMSYSLCLCLNCTCVIVFVYFGHCDGQ